jgi:hypothetical protein
MARPSLRYAGQRCVPHCLILPLVIALTLGACGGNSTGPSSVILAGSYASTVSASFNNAYETLQNATTGTITLNTQDASGNFTGSYVMQDGSSGTIAGNVRADGGFTVTQFGNPNITPLSSLLVLQNRFPYCNWAGAGSTGVSGSVVGKSLTITGSINVLCSYNTQSGTVSAPTVVSFTITGTRP